MGDNMTFYFDKLMAIDPTNMRHVRDGMLFVWPGRAAIDLKLNEGETTIEDLTWQELKAKGTFFI